MRIRVLLALLFACSAGKALAGANPQVTLPLHAVVGGQPSCNTSVNCGPIYPTINVPPSTMITVNLLLFRHCEVMGVQTASSAAIGTASQISFRS